MDKLTGVDATLVSRVKQILGAMAALGFPMIVIQGIRTDIYQLELYMQGRDINGNVVDPKKVVTNCDGVTKKSQHQLGKAVDCCFVAADGKLLWEGPWSLYGAMGKALGLTWGGDFKSIRDLDHLEIA